MGYSKNKKYKKTQIESYKVIRKCSGCGCKMKYENTNRFRVNANGNNIDIWLIYQCKKCKHTYNLCIYERIKKENIPSELYEKFLENDKELSLFYGTNKGIFIKNKAQVD